MSAPPAEPLSPQTRRRLLALAATALPALGAACGPAGTPPTAGPATAVPGAPGSTPAPAAVPGKPGGTVNFAVTSDPLLNPILTGDVSGVVMTKLLFNGLTRPDRQTLEPRPDLATSWEPSDNGATWTFTLRDGVKWHDGAPFTAEDVKFTFESILDPKVNTVMRGHFKGIRSVDAPDAKTVRFALAEPFAAFPTFMGHLGTVSVGIIPKHVLAGQDINTATFNKAGPIGTGPFKMKEFKAADHVTLVAYDGYHFGRPKLDAFNWKILPDSNTQLAQVRTGELTKALLSPVQVQGLKGNPDLKVENAARVGFSYVGLNKSRPLFGDVRVRRAMLHALNRELIIQKIHMNEYVIAHGPVPPAIAWAHEPNVTKYAYDPARAKALLAEAGWTPGADGVLAKDGQRFVFKLTASRSPINQQITAEMQQSWKGLGMESEIELLEFGVFINERRDSHNYDVMLHGWSLPPDPDQYNYWHSSAITGGGLNAGEYRNPEVDRLLEEGRRTLDQARRKEIYSRFQKLMADDLPELWLWNSAEIRAGTSRLEGLGPRSYYDVELHYVSDWSLR